MDIQSSIKRKIFGWLVVFSFTISACFALLMLAYSWMVEDNIFNRMLAVEAQYLEQQYELTGEVTLPRHPFMTLHRGWNELPGNIAQQRALRPTQIEFDTPTGGTLHTQEVPLGGTVYVLAGDVGLYEVSRDYLPVILPWIGMAVLVVCVVAVLIAWYLAALIINPVQYLANTVQQTESDELLGFDRRFKNDEIGYLALAIQRNFNQLQRALKREADFTRDVSHELRTPTAVLKMRIETLVNQHDVEGADAEQLKESLQHIEQTLDVLLALSRDASFVFESFGLLEAIERSVINHAGLSNVDDFDLRIDVPSAVKVNANAHLFELLMTNVLDNALNHASSRSLHIRLDDAVLRFVNPASAVPSGDILSSGVRGQSSDGMGQGLHLIKRICEVFGWRVETRYEGEFELLVYLP